MRAPRRQKAVHRPVTIREVAERAGVSTATVSRTLASPMLVRAEVRERVNAAIAATGYTPNVAARNLRARRSMMVLVVVPNLANPFFAQILRGVDDELAAAGYGMIVGNLDNLVAREARYVDLVFSGQVDGALLLTSRVPEGNGRRMSDFGLPMAAICVAVTGTDLPHVVVEEREASRAVVAHLAALGHRRFGYVAGPPRNFNEIERRHGFREGLEEAGLDPDDAIYWPGNYTFATGVAAAEDFLTRSPRPTAVYATNDEMAIAFIKVARTAGLRVPEDLSVVGFDAIDFADFVEPTLTTVRQPAYEMGIAGARLLLAALSGEKVASIRIHSPLLVRASTAPPPDAVAARPARRRRPETAR